MKFINRAMLGLMAMALAGCAGAISDDLTDPYSAGPGLVYFMPTTVTPISVSVDFKNDDFAIIVDDSVYIADEAHRYRLETRHSAFHKDDFRVNVTEKGLLTSVDLKSVSEVEEIVEAAARSAAALGAEGAEASGPGVKVVAEITVDLGALAEPDGAAVERVNRRINAALRKTLSHYEELPAFLNAARAALNAGERVVLLSVTRSAAPAHVGPGAPARSAADCTIGFCYRLKAPFVIRLTLFGNSVSEHTRLAPNGGEIYASALRRGVFADLDTNVRLTDGVLTSYDYAHIGSEAEGVATVPTTVIGGLATGVTNRGDLFTAESTLIENEIGLIEARREYLAAEKEAARKNTSSISAEGAETGPSERFVVRAGAARRAPSQLDETPAANGEPGDLGPEGGAGGGDAEAGGAEAGGVDEFNE